MNRPWIIPENVKEYTDSDKVKSRSDEKLAIDIMRAEKYVIFHTHNKFDAEEYDESLPQDVKTALVLLAESYAMKAIQVKNGNLKSESFDDYSYTIDDTDDLEKLGLGVLLEDYVLPISNGSATIKLRKL